MKGWINIKDKLPLAGVMVIAYGKSKYDKPIIIRAFYTPTFTIEECDDDSDWLDYDEVLDRYCLPGGWYESNEFEETHWKVDIKITHWMPLPEPPKEE